MKSPDYSVSHGDILKEILFSRGFPIIEFAKRISISTRDLSKIINGHAPIPADTALALENAVGVKANVWINLESNFQLFKERKK